jgi:hypothetical protein
MTGDALQPVRIYYTVPDRAFVTRKLRIEGGQDMPEVEDIPLIPEDETPEFRDLSNCLPFRHLRAFEHWRGNTHLALAAIIARVARKASGLDDADEP